MTAIKSIIIFSLALLSVACTGERVEEITVPGNDFRVEFHVAESAGSKALFGEPSANSYPVLWQGNEDIDVCLNEHVNAAIQNSIKTQVASSPSASASWSADFSGVISKCQTTAPYRFYAFYPGKNLRAFYYQNQHRIKAQDIPSTQTPSATSCDPNAIFIYSISDEYENFPSVVEMPSFKHMTAYGCLTLEGIPEDATVSSVTITSNPEQCLSGPAWYYYDTDIWGDYSTTGLNYVCINTSSKKDIWFGCRATDQLTSLSFEVATDKGTFRKTTSPGKQLLAGRVARISVTFPQEEQQQSVISSIYELNDGVVTENSHAAFWQSSNLEMDYRSYTELTSGSLPVSLPVYTRIKKMANGLYLLMYQETTGSASCYYAISEDLKSWTNKGYLFQINGSTKYKNPDALVLDNGDILAFACRGGKIVVKRSTDNALSWSGETVLYEGQGMEPSAIQLKQGAHKGEIQVFYTKSDTSRGYSHGYGDSGTGLITSTDGGYTWSLDSGKIIRQCTGVWPTSYEYNGSTYSGDGEPIYTDQMAVGVELTAGQGVAVACESRFIDKYYLTVARDNTNWSFQKPSYQASCPDDRDDNFSPGAGPYMRQFPSGETVLSYNNSGAFWMRMGSSRADSFTEKPVRQVFSRSGGGCWGSVEVDDSHVLIASYPLGYNSGSNRVSDILISRFILNHMIEASQMDITVDGSNSEWNDVREALFIGSDTMAQTCFRFAYSEENLYVLVERLDDDVRNSDVTALSFSVPGRGSSLLDVSISPKSGGTVTSNNSKVSCCGLVYSGLGEGGRNGYIAEIAIPRTLLNSSSELLFYAMAQDGSVRDSFDGVNSSDVSGWIPISL